MPPMINAYYVKMVTNWMMKEFVKISEEIRTSIARQQIVKVGAKNAYLSLLQMDSEDVKMT